MTYERLTSSWAKFERAGIHLQRLHDEVVRLGVDHPEPIATEHYLTPTEGGLCVTKVPDFSGAALLVGDTVNNLRAALDHAIWEMVRRGTERRLTTRQALQVQYPFARSWASLKAHRGQRMPGISDDYFAIVRRYQPYRRDHIGTAMRALRQFSDMDKHRFVVPAAVMHDYFENRITVRGCEVSEVKVWSHRRPLKVGSKLVQVLIVPTAPEYSVHIESNMALQPSLPGGFSLYPMLFAMHGVVLEALLALDMRLGGPDTYRFATPLPIPAELYRRMHDLKNGLEPSLPLPSEMRRVSPEMPATRQNRAARRREAREQGRP